MAYIGNAPYQGSVAGTNILDGTIETVDLKDGNVTGAKLETLAGLTSGTYGNSTAIPTITIDVKGRVTAISTTAVSIPSGSISVTGGDLTLSGSTGTAITDATLTSVGTAGTYTKITTDAKGRVTSGTTLASSDLPTYTGTITSSQVTTALGFTPYNSTNPSGYITSSGTAAVSIIHQVTDSRSTVTTPQSINMGVVFDFKQNTTENLSDGGTYFGQMTFRQYGSTTDWSGGLSHQLGFTDNGNIWQRSGSSTTWGSWKKIWDSSNLTNLNQLTNGPGYITGYTETDTLATVTGRGASTSIRSTFNGGWTVPDATVNYAGNFQTTDYSTFTFMSRAWSSVQGTNGIAYQFNTHSNAGNSGYNALQINYGEGGKVQASTSFRAPIFYDSDDTAYYADPNSTSSMWNVNIRGDANSTATGNQIFFWGSGSSTTSAIGFKANGGYFGNPTGNGDGYNTYLTMDTDGRGWVFRRGVGGTDFSSAYTSGWILNNGVWQANASMRAPIFYDSNNTSYYVDPASTTYLNTTYLQGGKFYTTSNGSGNSIDIYMRAHGDDTYVWRHIYGGSGTGYGTGVGGYGIYNQTLGGNYSLLFNSAGYVTAPYSLRSPIFYDSDNTAYYADLSSTGDSIRAAGNIVAYYSDDRLKTKLGNITDALKKVNQLNGFYYQANELAQSLGYKPTMEVGVSAQEVEQILPQIVKPAPIDQQYKTVDYSRLVPLLIEAVKELSQKLSKLEAKYGITS